MARRHTDCRSGSEPVAIAVSVAASGAATAFVADFGAQHGDADRRRHAAARRGHSRRAGPADDRRRAAGRCWWATSATAPSPPINPATLQAGGTVALPLNPTGIAVAPSGTTAYVCGGAAVVAVAVVGLTVGAPVALPDVAQGIALSATARRRG